MCQNKFSSVPVEEKKRNQSVGNILFSKKSIFKLATSSSPRTTRVPAIQNCSDLAKQFRGKSVGKLAARPRVVVGRVRCLSIARPFGWFIIASCSCEFAITGNNVSRRWRSQKERGWRARLSEARKDPRVFERTQREKERERGARPRRRKREEGGGEEEEGGRLPQRRR